MQRAISILCCHTGLSAGLWLDATAQASTTACCSGLENITVRNSFRRYLTRTGVVLDAHEVPDVPREIDVSGYAHNFTRSFAEFLRSHRQPPAIYLRLKVRTASVGVAPAETGPPVAIS